MKKYILIPIIILFISTWFINENLTKKHPNSEIVTNTKQKKRKTTFKNKPPIITGKTVKSRFPSPTNFERILTPKGSFQSYLRALPLKPIDSKVLYYDGSVKENHNVYQAVVDLPIGKRNLHQCADAIMRLKAEYLFKSKQYDKIHFIFTNGFVANYSKWKAGYRIKVNGNKVTWRKTSTPSVSYQSFWKYLEMVFSYAGTSSLSKELIPKPISKIEIGDIFIIGGFPGHAIIVVDMVKNQNTGKHKMMLAQSYMPAQELQILNNKIDGSVWYDTDFEDKLMTPEWIFGKNNLMSFTKE